MGDVVEGSNSMSTTVFAVVRFMLGFNDIAPGYNDDALKVETRQDNQHVQRNAEATDDFAREDTASNEIEWIEVRV